MELNYDLNMTGLERDSRTHVTISIQSKSIHLSLRKKSFDRWPVDKNGVSGAYIELTYIIKA